MADTDKLAFTVESILEQLSDGTDGRFVEIAACLHSVLMLVLSQIPPMYALHFLLRVADSVLAAAQEQEEATVQ